MSGKEENMSNELEDDLDGLEVSDEPALDQDKLAALKAKMSKKQENMPPKIIQKKTRSLNIGVVGSGQAGSRLASCFNSLGYTCLALNTAQQDLDDINIPEANKLLLDYGLGGAAKELTIGRDAALAHRDSINELVHDKLSDCDVLILATSLGGGSGAGSCEVLIDIMSSMGRPLCVIAALPMSNEDAQTKSNALQTLSVLSKSAQNKQIHNLIVVDNAKIESIYSDVSQMNFYKVSNNAIVEPIDVFNTLSFMKSDVKSLDPMEFAKIFTDGEGLTVYGKMIVEDYEDESAIAEAIIDNLNGNLLASGFDLKQSKYVGAMIVAPKRVWDKVPASSVNYAMTMINDLCGNPQGVFKGIYEVESEDDVIKVYSMFSGLGLPADRVEQLKTDVKVLKENSKSKETVRNLTLKMDTGTEETVAAADKIREKIKANKSAFGGLLNKSIKDRRK